jgi:Na+/H+-dicarboxylate symporter
MVVSEANIIIWIIFIGGFLGGIANLLVKYRVKKEEFKNVGNYVIAIILGLAVYGLYYYLVSAGLVSSNFAKFALFCFAVLLGYALNEIVKNFVSLIKKAE